MKEDVRLSPCDDRMPPNAHSPKNLVIVPFVRSFPRGGGGAGVSFMSFLANTSGHFFRKTILRFKKASPVNYA